MPQDIFSPYSSSPTLVTTDSIPSQPALHQRSQENPHKRTLRAAAIDIGTNTLLMTIGEASKHEDSERMPSAQATVTILRDEHAIARLGAGVDASRTITEAGIERASEILRRYAAICREENVETVACVTTSAVRDASNAEHVIAALSAALGHPVRVISGEEEARLSFVGSAELPASTTSQSATNLTTVMDIGGGSTEFVTGSQDGIASRVSLQLGAVRLHERFFCAPSSYTPHTSHAPLPPSTEALNTARAEIQAQLTQHVQQAQHVQHVPLSEYAAQRTEHKHTALTGVGGTFTTLAAIDLGLKEFNAASVHGHTLSRETVGTITTMLLRSSLSELLANPAIHPQRADILPAGALILHESMTFLSLDSCTVSTRGLRYGVLYEALGKTR
jgi:exopolyphosphatase / guanosine-5'-triphosphate,3'-diphosphate pyrophosphatase